MSQSRTLGPYKIKGTQPRDGSGSYSVWQVVGKDGERIAAGITSRENAEAIVSGLNLLDRSELERANRNKQEYSCRICGETWFGSYTDHECHPLWIVVHKSGQLSAMHARTAEEAAEYQGHLFAGRLEDHERVNLVVYESDFSNPKSFSLKHDQLYKYSYEEDESQD